MATITTVQCPSCDTAFPIDADKVPAGGARTQCTVCQTMFRVDPPASEAWVPGAGDVGDETEAAVEFADEAAGEAEGDFADAPFERMESADVEPIAALEAGDAEDAFAPAADEGVDGTDWATTLGDESEEVSGTDWATGLEDDWVLETEESGPLGGVEVDRLDTVEEQMRSAADESVEPEAGIDQVVVPGSEQETFSGYMGADEMVLSVDDLGGAIDTGPAVEGELDEGASEESGFGELEGEEPEEAQPEDAVIGEPMAAGEPAASEPPPEPAPATFTFGKRDPHDKARRLARVLVSDMITYNPDRHARALEAGTLKVDFDEEIEKSWAEYVEQVGSEIAESTSYWTDALNEILAKGEALF